MKNKKRIYTKHGMTGTKIHEVWKEMCRRCRGTSKNSIKYYRKNVTVCRKWRDASEFIQWALMNGYKEGLVLDRISNTKGYSPNNCRWSTPKESANNKENTIYLTYNGETLPLAFWAEKLGVNHHSLWTRYSRGWSDEKIITTPIKKRRSR